MYKAPVDEIAFTLKHVAGMADALQSGALGDLGEDLVDAILAEAGRFATEEVAPLGDIGDEAVAQNERAVQNPVLKHDFCIGKNGFAGHLHAVFLLAAPPSGKSE